MPGIFQPSVFQPNVFQIGETNMAAAPASAAAALALINAQTGYLNSASGFDLGQLVGATNDANALMFSRDHNNGANAYVMFVSAATSVASAGVLAIARAFRAVGIDVVRYVISTTDLQVMSGPDATATFSSFAIVPTQVEWIAAVAQVVTTHNN